MSALGRRWKPLLVITLVAGVAIGIVGPNHIDLQMADDAADFRAHLSEPGRHLAAAIIDVVFAAAYGALGLAILQLLGTRGPVAAVTGGAIAAGAIFDEIENAFLIANIVRRDTVSDGWITAMQVPGTLKWIGALGAVSLLVLLVRHALRRRGPDREEAVATGTGLGSRAPASSHEGEP